jgi:hypothetical protein
MGKADYLSVSKSIAPSLISIPYYEIKNIKHHYIC